MGVQIPVLDEFLQDEHALMTTTYVKTRRLPRTHCSSGRQEMSAACLACVWLLQLHSGWELEAHLLYHEAVWKRCLKNTVYNVKGPEMSCEM